MTGSGARWFAGRGEKLRRDLDFDHWASFGWSFALLTDRLREVATGRHGAAPASITVLSGDVHHAYLAEVDLGVDAGAASRVHQMVCSPIRNPLEAKERRVIRFASSGAARALGRLLRWSAKAPKATIDWRVVEGPWFDNQIATLRLDGRHAEVRLDKTIEGEDETEDEDPARRLERVFNRSLTG